MHGNVTLSKQEIVAFLVDHMNDHVLGAGAFVCDEASISFQIVDGDVTGILVGFVPRPEEPDEDDEPEEPAKAPKKAAKAKDDDPDDDDDDDDDDDPDDDDDDDRPKCFGGHKRRAECVDCGYRAKCYDEEEEADKPSPRRGRPPKEEKSKKSKTKP
jgi:hypothetical protein